MFDHVPKDIWFILLGLLGGLASIMLGLSSVDSEQRKELFRKGFWIELALVFLVAIPVAYFSGTHVLELGYGGAAFPVSYFAAVVSKDITRKFAEGGLSGIISVFTKR